MLLLGGGTVALCDGRGLSPGGSRLPLFSRIAHGGRALVVTAPALRHSERGARQRFTFGPHERRLVLFFAATQAAICSVVARFDPRK